MSEPKFIHLRVHSAYSLSQGAMQIKTLASKLKDANTPAIAVTDTNNMFGQKAFSSFASKAGVKPILGVTLDLHNNDNDDEMKTKGIHKFEAHKIVLLAKSELGYQNLMHIMKHFYLDNNAELLLSDLETYNEDIICLSGGVDGVIGHLLLDNRQAEAEKNLVKLKDIFGDRFYLEVSRLGLEAEEKTEDKVIELAYKYNIPLVATNPVFFFDKSMHEAHDALACIAAGEYVSNEDRKKYSPECYLKSEEEMAELFKDLPEALNNTVLIAKRCSFYSEFVAPLLPPFDCNGVPEAEFIQTAAKEGLIARISHYPNYEEIKEEYFKRLDYELGVINKMGFAGYFLIVADFITWSKQNGIPVGPGRGSGAGSIVAWSLKITDLDPIQWGLLFERFLNPERISMPDFDVDFCQDRRGETIAYVQNKYGFDKVAQIITYGKLQSKAVIRDVARVLQMPYSQADRISKMIPAGAQGRNPTLPEALEQVPELEEMRVSDPQVNKLFDIAIKLEGLYRHSGVHAAGVVIGDRVLEKLVPLYKDPRADMPVTQYDMKFIEETGLIKFDFLGLKTLTVIKRAVDWIKKNHNVDIDLETLPLDDKEAYELLTRGDTAGVFQFESAGMKDVHQQIKPDRFEDLIAIVSLYRPGPMDNIPSYIKRKHGEEEVVYLHPALEPILKETYGIMIYQEQVMKIAQVLGGYTLGGADKLRKVMGKKMIDEIPKQRKMFIEGALENEITEEVAGAIFDQMEKFASYGFNKSHAAAYSLISYQTAYLKAHYPTEFMCATMDLDKGNTDKLAFFKDECVKMGIDVLQPDVNVSGSDFTVVDGKIAYALSAIKGAGDGGASSIENERKQNGNYKSISDFIKRSDYKSINRKLIENFIKAGAFDCLDNSRGKLFANLDTIIQNIAAATEEKNSAQMSMFGAETISQEVKLADKPDFANLEKLKLEAEAVGFYLSAHPLDNYKKAMEKLGVKKFSDIAQSIQAGDKIKANLAGCLNSLQIRTSQKGNKYGFLSLSDENTSFEGIVFSDTLDKCQSAINSGYPLFAQATVEKADEASSPRILFNNIKTIDGAISERANSLIIGVTNIEAVKKIKEIYNENRKSRNKIYIKVDNKDFDLRIELKEGLEINGSVISKLKSTAGVSFVEEI
ncbi:MAG: DNA polymerase III subunit alpha [Alphaproteobacteria bacterium]